MSREKSNMESIMKETMDNPQPTKKLGYTTLMVKEEDFEEDLAEDGHAKHLSQKPTVLEEPEVDIYSVLVNEENLADGGRDDSKPQGTYMYVDPQPRHVNYAGSIIKKEGDCTEEDGAIEMNLHLSDEVYYQILKKEDVHVDDGCSKEDNGKGINALQLGEVSYQTLTRYVKEESLDSDSLEGVVNGANLGIMPQPSGEEGVEQHLLISDGRVQRLDDDFSSQAERGARLDSSESESFTSRCGSCNLANDGTSGQEQSVAEKETSDQGLSHHVYGQMNTERTNETDEKCEETLIEGIGQSSQFGGTEKNLAKPLLTGHIAGEPYMSQCPFCKKEFSNVFNVESHSITCLRRPTGEMIYKCSLCTNKRFTQSVHLLRHARNYHKGKKSSFQCCLCNEIFPYLSSLMKHVKSHSQGYRCFVCDLRFSSADHLSMHKISHRRDQPCECAVCKKRFPDGLSLAYHTRTHVGRIPYQHSVCDLKFYDEERPTGVNGHKRIHTGKKLHECHICNKIFLYERYLTSHMKHVCSDCHLCFSNEKGLMSHMKTHTGKKPTGMCSVCGEMFHDNFDLSLHMRSSHTEEKPYQCSVCSERFSKANSLLIHMKSHPAENPTNVWFVP